MKSCDEVIFNGCGHFYPDSLSEKMTFPCLFISCLLIEFQAFYHQIPAICKRFSSLHFNNLATNNKYRKMKPGAAINYYAKIKSLLTPNKFKFVKYTIENSANEQLEAFYNMLIAGYPIDFAIANYTKLHEYLKNNAMDYSEALDTYISYPGLGPGIYMVKTKWYELN